MLDNLHKLSSALLANNKHAVGSNYFFIYLLFLLLLLNFIMTILIYSLNVLKFNYASIILFIMFDILKCFYHNNYKNSNLQYQNKITIIE